MLAIVLLLAWFSPLYSQTVEIVSNMYTEEILPEGCLSKIRAHSNLIITDLTNTDLDLLAPTQVNPDCVLRYILFNIRSGRVKMKDYPTDKKVLFMMEPERIQESHASGYSRVYTWDDDAIDNVKYFKYYFPDLKPMIEDLIPFEEKKFCVMINRNWYPKHRKPILEFFAKKSKGEFDFYGKPFPGLLFSQMYRGRIPGLNCGNEKINVLKQYKFCICFENNTDLNGYITEKIFPCFASGCVPIYWGAPNVLDYIPKDCFIDYRDFNDDEALYEYLKSMSKEEYELYIQSIRCFLKSDKAQVFTPEYFSQTIYEAVFQ